MYSIQNQLFLPTLRSDYPAILLTSFALVFKARSEVFDGLSFSFRWLIIYADFQVRGLLPRGIKMASF